MKTNIGILLANIGTPEYFDVCSVRKYLAEFLSDPRVIQIPKLIWWPLLHGIILRTRPRYAARNYLKIWTSEGSPLLVHSQQIVNKLTLKMQTLAQHSVKVKLGMRYGNPSIADALKQFEEENCKKILIFPLFPQYSATTTASIFDAISTILRTRQAIPEIRMITHYCFEANYIDTLTAYIKNFWLQSQQNHLLFSFHGIPKIYSQKGDPYESHCSQTVEHLVEKLNLANDQWSLGYQSRLGRTPWLQPYTDKLLQDLPKKGIRNVDIVCPGFAVDCLETLEEIAIRNKELFLAAGGQQLRYIPALNASDLQIEMLAEIALKNLGGWI